MVGADTGQQDLPPNSGATYGTTSLDSTTDPEVVFPVGVATTSWSVKVLSAGGGDVYFGWDDQVDSSTGFPVAEGGTISIDLDNQNQPLYAIPDNAGAELRYIAVR